MENKENIKKQYKYCTVPMCNNTTVSTPNKIFFQVPKLKDIRDKWCKTMRRAPLSHISTTYCCEDHFNLEEDVQNYTEHKLMNRTPRLKKGLIPTRFVCQNRPDVTPPQDEKRRKLDVESASEVFPTASTSREVFQQIENLPEEWGHNFEKEDKVVQVNIKPSIRSKSTQTQTQSTKTIALSPIRTKKSPLKKLEEVLSSSSPSTATSDEYIPNESSEDSAAEEIENEIFKSNMARCSIECIQREPRLLLGLPRESYFLIKALSEEIPCEYKNILITLKKIRLNFAFAILALDFGMSVSNVSRIFKRTLLPMATKLNQLIYWPNKESIQMHLPIPFRARYKNLSSIIDCFEIEIEKPSNPIHQALTWSDYYKCNTIKYLVSCTPDGLVNYVSNGYGGRASDVTIIEDSEYLDRLEPGVGVMADRGFKNFAHMLQQRQCILVRPPSVYTGIPSTKSEVKQSKRIAALRIHVERVIGRIREFKMLLPHACVDNHMISYMDLVVKIACGIINLQDHLIKIQI